jgi:hypothetical protein
MAESTGGASEKGQPVFDYRPDGMAAPDLFAAPCRGRLAKSRIFVARLVNVSTRLAVSGQSSGMCCHDGNETMMDEASFAPEVCVIVRLQRILAMESEGATQSASLALGAQFQAVDNGNLVSGFKHGR